MKKILVLMLACLFAFTAVASAETIGSTGLTFTLPSGFAQDSLTSEDIADGMVGYYYNDYLEFEIYVDDMDYTVREVLESYSDDDELIESGLIQEAIAGLTFGYASFSVSDDEYGNYYLVIYVTQTGSSLIQFYFYMDALSYTTYSDNIIATVSSGSAGTGLSYSQATVSSGSAVAVGNTGLVFELPADYAVEELTADDIADDMTAYWTTDELDIVVYEYDSGFDSIDDIRDDVAQDSSVSQSGLVQMPSGLQFAYYVLQDSGYTDVSYLTFVNGTTVQIDFWMADEDASTASAEAAQIINSIR